MSLNEQAQRGVIKRYVETAFTAKILHMNDARRNKLNDLSGKLSRNGYSRQSSAWLLGSVDVEEECICDLLHQKADLYLEAYKRSGLKIGPEVLQDISDTRGIITGIRKSTLIAEAQLTGVRINRPQSLQVYAHLGREGSRAMKEVQAKIELYNLTPRRVDPMSEVDSHAEARHTATNLAAANEATLKLEHLREEYRLARHGLYGGFLTTLAAIVGLIFTASAKMQMLGGYYVWIVLIVAAAVVIYFSFVFGRLASIKAKITKTQLDLNMQAGGPARKV